jgi:mono/diheme cytochrome c family protein
MPVKITIACTVAALLLLMSALRLSGQAPQGTQPQTTKSLKTVPITYSKPDSGAHMFKDYCAACHGVDGKGNGPAVVFLKAPPPDLCTMAQRNKEKYPAGKVVYMLNFGPGSQAHGALDMPTWGPLFRSLDTEPRLNVAE